MKDYLFQECHPVLFNQFWRIKFRTLDKQLKVFKFICQKISLKLRQIFLNLDK